MSWHQISLKHRFPHKHDVVRNKKQHVSGLKVQKKNVPPEVPFIFRDLLAVEYKTVLSPTQNDKTPSDVLKVHKSVMIVDLVGGFNPSEKY